MDDQMGFDIEFDDTTQAFLDWVAPERMESEVQAFLAKVVPDIEADAQWWKPPLSTEIMEASARLFGDWDGFLAADNRELADRYIRFQGECYLRRASYGWMNVPEWGPPLYTDFGPSVRFGNDTYSDVSMVAIAKRLFKDDGPAMIEYSITDAGRYARKNASDTQ
ncbi:hypothetical protein NONI108955_41110 [Nocardia ninae]|uniref:Uncharacterized protein n=1 Tax=Nocardia ninae NBRC 108245 TaxID=1210091 RepID=A0A511MG19_9NOCA|nr:hypothetical protein [Nocardia ninae]GEM39018.1 hypothetical protein NN4_35370 [Nocardia ninae NBRC 108245]